MELAKREKLLCLSVSDYVTAQQAASDFWDVGKNSKSFLVRTACLYLAQLDVHQLLISPACLCAHPQKRCDVASS